MLTLNHTRVAAQLAVTHNDTGLRLSLGIETSIFDNLTGNLGRWLSGWRRDLRLIWYAAAGNEAGFYATT